MPGPYRITDTRSRRSELGRVERVALIEAAALEAALEPADALRRGAVGEGVGDDGAARLALQPVVADRGGGVERLLDVSLLEHVAALLGAARPDPGEAVGLKLEPDREPVRVGAAARLLLGRVHLARDAEQRLHVMADLVRDHV